MVEPGIDLDKYYEHYIEKYTERTTREHPLKIPAKDYENMKYLIKTFNSRAQDPAHINTKPSYFMLKKAEKLGTILWKNVISTSSNKEIVKKIAILRSLTLNNLGCYFKVSEKFNTSLDYLQKAVKIEKKGNVDEYEIATTLLNLTAVLSKTGNHASALQESFKAVMILERVDEEKEIPEVLSSAYFNYAVELEFLNRKHESKANYEKAYEISMKKLGENHPFTANFLEKLVQFNFSNADLSSIVPSETTTGKSPSSVLNLREKAKIDVIFQDYKVFSGIRFKIIIIDKHKKRLLKVLAFPQNKYPVYRILLDYDKVLEALDYPFGKSFQSIVDEELVKCMKKLTKLLVIEKGAMVLASSHCKRPFSAGINFTVTTEKYGAKFTATLKNTKFYDTLSSKFK